MIIGKILATVIASIGILLAIICIVEFIKNRSTYWDKPHDVNKEERE